MAQFLATRRVVRQLDADWAAAHRELKVETTARTEERKAKEAIAQARDSLQATNANLIHQANVDRASLARKDRVIAELRGERDYERELRRSAESDLSVQVKSADDTVHELKAALSAEAAERKRAANQYDVLAGSWNRLDAEYRRRIADLREALAGLERERRRDHEAVQRLEVTVEQQRQELEKLTRAKRGIEARCEETIRDAEDGCRDVLGKAREREDEMESVTAMARSALGEMRHAMAVNRDLRPETEAERREREARKAGGEGGGGG